MAANLLAQQIDPRRIPLVLQYNKRDLPAVMPIADLLPRAQRPPGPGVPGRGHRGRGCPRDLRRSILSLVDRGPLPHATRRCSCRPGQTVEAWTTQAVRGDVRRPPGWTRWRGAPGGRPPRRRTQRPRRRWSTSSSTSPPPQDAPAGAARRSEARTADALAESYAEASAELGLAVSELREERDLLQGPPRGGAARPRAGDRGPGEDRRRGARPGDPAGAGARRPCLRRHAAALHGRGGAGAGAGPARGDPLSRTVWGARPRGRAADARGAAASRRRTARSSWRRRCATGVPSFEAVAFVPLRSAERLLGLALLYFDPYALCPPATGCVHLGFLARVLSGPLEALAAREAALAGDRLKVLSRASAAAVASLLTRLPSDLARKQPLRIAEFSARCGCRASRWTRRLPGHACWATRRSCASRSRASCASARPTRSSKARSPRSRCGSRRSRRRRPRARHRRRPRLGDDRAPRAAPISPTPS